MGFKNMKKGSFFKPFFSVRAPSLALAHEQQISGRMTYLFQLLLSKNPKRRVSSFSVEFESENNKNLKFRRGKENSRDVRAATSITPFLKRLKRKRRVKQRIVTTSRYL